MQSLDYAVLLIYLAGVLVVGLLFASRNRTTAQMFAAGEQCPWWVSGLSSFMTMFSAGTFVVWGGIAYKYGLVAVTINLCYGIAALLAGWTVAGKWKKVGIESAAQFVKLRFGEGALQLYTWSMMLFRLIGSGVGLYSLCILLVGATGSTESSLGMDTSSSWLAWSIVGIGGVIVFYTIVGGLWGVLMVDVLQFTVLNIAVLFIVPLVLADVGGIENLVDRAPAGFFSLTSNEYSWAFLVGWIVIHYFVVGAEWAYVQRYLCVPSERDARKSAYLFGALYLVSPLLWMLPPLAQRVRDPLSLDADARTIQLLAENAYIEVCLDLLPAGMLGLVLAAMISATASTVSGQLNVFAGAITSDVIRPRFRYFNDDRRLVWVGRSTTLLLGVGIIAIALAIPHLGGAERVIVPATSLVVVPLLAPLLVGLIAPKLPTATVWITAILSALTITAVKIALPAFDWNNHTIQAVAEWTTTNVHSTDILLGAALPGLVIALCYLCSPGISSGWHRLQQLPPTTSPPVDPSLHRQILRIMTGVLGVCALLMIGLAATDATRRGLLAFFGIALAGLTALLFYRSGRSPGSKSPPAEHALERN